MMNPLIYSDPKNPDLFVMTQLPLFPDEGVLQVTASVGQKGDDHPINLIWEGDPQALNMTHLPTTPLPRSQLDNVQKVPQKRAPLDCLPANHETAKLQNRFLTGNDQFTAAAAKGSRLRQALTANVGAISAAGGGGEGSAAAAAAVTSCDRCGFELSSKCLMQTCRSAQPQPPQLLRRRESNPVPAPGTGETLCKRCGQEMTARCLLATCM